MLKHFITADAVYKASLFLKKMWSDYLEGNKDRCCKADGFSQEFMNLCIAAGIALVYHYCHTKL